MPRFFFHISDGQKTYADSNGADLIDAGAAEAFARIIVGDLESEVEYGTFYVDVRDESDKPVMKLYISTRH